MAGMEFNWGGYVTDRMRCDDVDANANANANTDDDNMYMPIC